MSVPRRYVQKWAPWSITPARNASAWTRLPINRPCMSVIATIRVSIRPSRTMSSSSSSRACLAWPWSSLLIGFPSVGRNRRSPIVRWSRSGRVPTDPAMAGSLGPLSALAWRRSSWHGQLPGVGWGEQIEGIHGLPPPSQSGLGQSFAGGERNDQTTVRAPSRWAAEGRLFVWGDSVKMAATDPSMAATAPTSGRHGPRQMAATDPVTMPPPTERQVGSLSARAIPAYREERR